MPTKSTVQTAKLKTRADQLREEIELAQRKLSRLEALPQDEYENGAVLIFEKKFDERGIKYTYVVVKAGGFWYVTGQLNRFSWDGLTDFLFGTGQSLSVQVNGFYVTEIQEI